jgi:hypothetical protein
MLAWVRYGIRKGLLWDVELTERNTIFDIIVEYHHMRYNTIWRQDEYFDADWWIRTNVLDALDSRPFSSVLDRGDAIASDDSKAAVNVERKRMMLSSGYLSLRLDDKRV